MRPLGLLKLVFVVLLIGLLKLLGGSGFRYYNAGFMSAMIILAAGLGNGRAVLFFAVLFFLPFVGNFFFSRASIGDTTGSER